MWCACTRLSVYRTSDVEDMKEVIVVRWLEQWLDTSLPPPKLRDVVDQVSVEEMEMYVISRNRMLEYVDRARWNEGIDTSLRRFVMLTLWEQIGNEETATRVVSRPVTADAVASMVRRIRLAFQWHPTYGPTLGDVYNEIVTTIETELDNKYGWLHTDSETAIDTIQRRIESNDLPHPHKLFLFVLARWLYYCLSCSDRTRHSALLSEILESIPGRNAGKFAVRNRTTSLVDGNGNDSIHPGCFTRHCHLHQPMEWGVQS